jgi:hypothetical protein
MLSERKKEKAAWVRAAFFVLVISRGLVGIAIAGAHFPIFTQW